VEKFNGDGFVGRTELNTTRNWQNLKFLLFCCFPFHYLLRLKLSNCRPQYTGCTDNDALSRIHPNIKQSTWLSNRPN
jgi:hypothetical protein